MALPAKLVNIDTIPHMDGLFQPGQELVGDIRLSLEALQPLLAPCSGWRRDEITTFRQRQRPQVPSSSTSLLPGAALDILRSTLPSETILASMLDSTKSSRVVCGPANSP